jgi:hypothetical protein
MTAMSEVHWKPQNREFVGGWKVPIAVSGDCQNQRFAAMARVAKAAFQIPSLFSLT